MITHIPTYYAIIFYIPTYHGENHAIISLDFGQRGAPAVLVVLQILAIDGVVHNHQDANFGFHARWSPSPDNRLNHGHAHAHGAHPDPSLPDGRPQRLVSPGPGPAQMVSAPGIAGPAFRSPNDVVFRGVIVGK